MAKQPPARSSSIRHRGSDGKFKQPGKAKKPGKAKANGDTGPDPGDEDAPYTGEAMADITDSASTPIFDPGA